MAEFSIQDAAFTGFRVVREHPAALAVWALFALLLTAVFSLILIGLIGPDLNQLMAAMTQPAGDPAAAAPLVRRIAPAYGLFILAGIGFNAILGAAMIRAVFQPADDRFGYLRFGADELRQLGLGLLMALLFLGAYFGLFLVLGILYALGTMASPLVGGVILALGIAAILAALLVLAVRFSLAPALTFESRRVNLFGSWSLTAGRFWPMAGTYLLTLVLIIMVYFLSSLVIVALGALVSGGDLGASMEKPDMSSLKAYFTPFRILQAVMSAGVSALVWPVLFTPSAAIYRRLSPGPSAADAFS